LGKKKLTSVPLDAVKLLGLKTKFPLGATLTLTVPGAFVASALAAVCCVDDVGPYWATATADEVRRTTTAAKCMMNR